MASGLLPVQIVLTEFDIDKGSCIRARYPETLLPCKVLSSPHCSPARGQQLYAQDSTMSVSWDPYLADQMLPDGAEKHAVSKSVFAINRPKYTPKVRLPVFVFIPALTVRPEGTPPLAPTAAPEAALLTAQSTTSFDEQHTLLHDGSDVLVDVPRSGTLGSSSSSKPITSWLRRRGPALPDGFISEVLQVEPYSGAVTIKDQLGEVTPVEVTGKQHMLTPCDVLPDEVSLFARRAKRFTAGEDWESVVPLPSLSDMGAPQTPTLIPQQAGSSSPAMSASATVSPAASIPYKFFVLRSTAFDQTYGLLMHDTHVKSLECVHAIIASSEGEGEVSGPYDAPQSSTLSKTCDSLVFSASSYPFVPQFDIEDDAEPTLYGVAAAVTRKDSTVRRGGINKSVALILPSLQAGLPFFSILVEAVEKCCEVKGNDVESVNQQQMILRTAFEVITKLLEDVAKAEERVSPLERRILYHCAGVQSPKTHMTVKAVTPFSLRHSVSVPLHATPLDLLTSRCSLTIMIESFRETFMCLVTSILCMKRIVVFSKALPSTSVCDATLALGIIGSAIEPQFIAKRVFPYTSINHMSLFRDVPGFIVGTLNPMFETQTKWWDVLVDLDAFTITASSSEVEDHIGLGSSSNTIGNEHVAFDKEAFKELFRGIVHLRALSATDVEIEQFSRAHLCEYVQSIAFLTSAGADPSRPPKGLPLKFVRNRSKMQVKRVALWMLTDMCDVVQQFASTSAAGIGLLVSALRRSQEFEDYEIMQLVQELLRVVQSPEDMDVLLAGFPGCLGSLCPLACKMFDPSLAVRMTVTALLRKIESHRNPLGKTCLTRLNSFLFNAYETLSRELPDTSAAY